jgi:hypothetical protein
VKAGWSDGASVAFHDNGSDGSSRWEATAILKFATPATHIGHCFCLGLDPHLSMIPSAFHRGDMKPASSATIGAIEDFLVAERLFGNSRRFGATIVGG